jgi:DNA-binding transcriptional MerR regulator
MYTTRAVALQLRITESALRNLIRRGVLDEPSRINGGCTLLWTDGDICRARQILEARKLASTSAISHI